MQKQKLPPLPNTCQTASHPSLSSNVWPGDSSPLSGSNNSFYQSTSQQSIRSSDLNTSFQSIKQTQNLTVKYNNLTFFVDPICLQNSSTKVAELIEPFIKHNYNISDLTLEITGNEFTNRNMDNFLKLCQNYPTDVQNSEMEEICKIAQLFQAKQIYHIGIQFIQRYIDQNFNVPSNLYDESNKKTYLFVRCDNSNIIHHENNLNDLEFDDTNTNNATFNETLLMSEDSTHPDNSHMQEYPNKEKIQLDNKDNNINNIKQEEINTTETVNSNPENNYVKINDLTDDQKKQEEDQLKNIKSVLYQVRCKKNSLKLPEYLFCMNGNILYSAKQKENDITIGKGSDVHINHHKSNHVGHIIQESNHRINHVSLKDQTPFEVKYVDSTKQNHLSLEVTFYHDKKKVTWTPKAPIFDTEKNRFYLDLHGMWNHSSIKSKKNIVLQDLSGESSLIVRKVDHNVFEIEACPIYDPLIIFAIGLSEIVGPYIDYYNEINNVL